jgi:hypothetical protein
MCAWSPDCSPDRKGVHVVFVSTVSSGAGPWAVCFPVWAGVASTAHCPHLRQRHLMWVFQTDPFIGGVCGTMLSSQCPYACATGMCGSGSGSPGCKQHWVWLSAACGWRPCSSATQHVQAAQAAHTHVTFGLCQCSTSGSLYLEQGVARHYRQGTDVCDGWQHQRVPLARDG